MEGGPPSFGPRFTGAVLLRDIRGRPLDFAYGTVALYGARFHALRLSNGFVTSAELRTARTGRIRGSKAVKRLTAAYRSRPRPSSTPGAKASTVCPYYLDGDQKADTESASALGVPARTRERAHAGAFPVSLALALRFSRAAERRGRGRRPQRSLKTQQRARRSSRPRRLVRSTCLRTGENPRPRPASRTQSLERR